MSSLSRRLSSVAVMLLALPSAVVAAAPAQAAEKVVTITAEGVLPTVLTVAAGDTVRIVNEDTSPAYRAISTSAHWAFDSGPVGLLPGRGFTVPDAITKAGTYTYRVAAAAPFNGSVVLVAAVRGDLPGTRTSRGNGLPAVLAAVLAAGVVSLLVRLLLAEPVARGPVLRRP